VAAVAATMATAAQAAQALLLYVTQVLSAAVVEL
jgi:hypothetical protein